MKEVAITGATGFLGRYLVECLLRTPGLRLRLLVRQKPADAEQWSARCEFVSVGDLSECTVADLNAAVQGCSSVAHLAWNAGQQDYLTSLQNLNSLSGTLKLAEAALRAGCEQFLGVGTVFEYDLSYGYLRADTPLKPSTLYAASKVAAQMTLEQMFKGKGCTFAWARIFYIWGEGEPAHKLSSAIRTSLLRNEPVALSSGNQIRDFVHASETAEKMARIVAENRGGVFNICSGRPMTVRDFALSIAREIDRPADLLHFGERPENLTDPPFVVGQPNI